MNKLTSRCMKNGRFLSSVLVGATALLALTPWLWPVGGTSTTLADESPMQVAFAAGLPEDVASETAFANVCCQSGASCRQYGGTECPSGSQVECPCQVP